MKLFILLFLIGIATAGDVSFMSDTVISGNGTLDLSQENPFINVSFNEKMDIEFWKNNTTWVYEYNAV